MDGIYVCANQVTISLNKETHSRVGLHGSASSYLLRQKSVYREKAVFR